MARAVSLSALPGAIQVALVLYPVLDVWPIVSIIVGMHSVRRYGLLHLSLLTTPVVCAAGVLGYYLRYTALLALWGLPHMEYLLLVNVQSATYWMEWAQAFQNLILAGLVRWVPIAVVGGAVLGWIAGAIYQVFFGGRRRSVVSFQPR